MAIWQRSKDHDDTGTDDRLRASRDAFVTEHDATFDFEAGWADVVARAGATPPATAPDRFERRPDAERDGGTFPVVVDPGRRPGRRRVLVGVGSIAAAAAVAAVLVVTGPDGGPGDDELTSRIVSATRSALADSVEHEVTDWSDTSARVDDEAWRDQTTAAVRFLHFAPDGSGRSLDVGPVEPPTPDDRAPTSGPHPHLSVDHCFEEWDVQDVPGPEGATRINASIARAVAEGLDDGSMVTDGTEVVDGRELLRYRDVANDGVVWLDPDTREIVKRRFSPGGEDEQGETYEYLARTPENLAVLVPEVPPGYTTPPAPSTGGQQTASGCG
jgi:hypothetical protein